MSNTKLIIGNKPLSELAAENIKQILMLIGCCASLEYWNEPIITDFDNKIFSDTIVVYFKSYRIEDNIEGREVVFFFNFKSFSYHYHLKNEDLSKRRPNGANIKLDIYKYLINEDFDIPIY